MDVSSLKAILCALEFIKDHQGDQCSQMGISLYGTITALKAFSILSREDKEKQK